jgi:hypothetical protein
VISLCDAMLRTISRIKLALLPGHENHLYTPKPTMTDAVLVIAALLLPMPNMLLLARTAASFALSWE